MESRGEEVEPCGHPGPQRQLGVGGADINRELVGLGIRLEAYPLHFT